MVDSVRRLNVNEMGILFRFRYIPGDMEQMITIFRRPGVRVSVRSLRIFQNTESPYWLWFQRERSDQNVITLHRVGVRSAGQYRWEMVLPKVFIKATLISEIEKKYSKWRLTYFRCEISAEAPLFNTVSRSGKMDVVGEWGESNEWWTLNWNPLGSVRILIQQRWYQLHGISHKPALFVIN